MNHRALIIALLSALVFVAMAVPTAVSIWYTNQVATHECQALELLVAIPAPKPSDPKVNPSREQSYRFHNAIVHWADSNGC